MAGEGERLGDGSENRTATAAEAVSGQVSQLKVSRGQRESRTQTGKVLGAPAVVQRRIQVPGEVEGEEVEELTEAAAAA